MANLRNRNSFQTALATSITISLYRTLLRVLSLKQLKTILPPAFLAGVIAGLGMVLHPADSRRVTATIYFLTRTLEFCYNLLDDKGYLPREKPWWFGSWLIFPLSSAQLLHSFVFDRDCFPRVPVSLTSLLFTSLLLDLLISGLRRVYPEIFQPVHHRSTTFVAGKCALATSVRNRRLPSHHLTSQLS